jgi:hypothetical protein
MAIWYLPIGPFEIVYCHFCVHLVLVFPHFGIVYQDKSGSHAEFSSNDLKSRHAIVNGKYTITITHGL